MLKTLGGEGRGYLSFPMRGFTLALDFRRRRGITTLLEKLTAITRDHGGRVYLAKDAVLSAEQFRAMYPKVASFEECCVASIRTRISPPIRRGASASSRRGPGRP